ncbi:hypothetical protein EDL96_05730 [Kocuria soli]|uniref:Uncharacterized protein n=1 Tax=Kocuria soli TaxID=2485125 RepID=A0A3N4AD55_9MICC|nr:hypothetical protein [Kocuria soli]ROZ63834.1 hypothetical protein EDL96_05730 [Kocuria soli]
MSIPNRLTVKPYTWTHDDGREERGYMIRRGAGFMFLDDIAAYRTCCELADLIDAANNANEQETDK